MHPVSTVPARRPRRALTAIAVGVAAMFCAGGASALGLMDAYQAALQNDSTYRSAYFANEGGKENRALGRSNLLPNISAAYSGTQNRTTDRLGSDPPFPQDYFSRSSTIQLRQVIFSLDAWARYKQGLAQADYSSAQFDSQSQEVILRVVSAYLDVLLKSDQLALAKAVRDTYREQMKVNDRMFEKGEGTKTDMLETQAKLDVAESQILDSQDELTTARDTLSTIVGADIGQLDPLTPEFRPRPADGVSFETWRQQALDHNPEVQTLTKGIEVARQEVNKQRAGHTPRIDFTATYGKTGSDSIDTINQNMTVRSLGVQVNIPLYSGGQVSASTRQAVAGQEKARADLQAQIDKTLTDLHKEYNLVASSPSRIEALVKAVDSSNLLITATEHSIQGGVRINLDLLTAEQQLYTNKRDLAQARYGYIMASLRLRAAAGTLSGNDVREFAPYFK